MDDFVRHAMTGYIAGDFTMFKLIKLMLQYDEKMSLARFYFLLGHNWRARRED